MRKFIWSLVLILLVVSSFALGNLSGFRRADLIERISCNQQLYVQCAEEIEATLEQWGDVEEAEKLRALAANLRGFAESNGEDIEILRDRPLSAASIGAVMLSYTQLLELTGTTRGNLQRLQNSVVQVRSQIKRKDNTDAT